MDGQNTPEESTAGAASYHSYMLRLWRTDRDLASSWRASLEDPRSGQRLGFASLEQLFAYLMEHLAGEAGRDTHSSNTA